MGRLLEALRAESEPRPGATLATLRHSGPSVAKVAESQRSPGVETERLLSALRAEGLPDEWLGLDHGDPADVAALHANTLRAYVRALADADLRERGKHPADETAAALCRSCGPVWLHPAVAAVAPTIDDWPRVLGCPWCHVANRRAIPRPLVRCGECSHFTRDAINPDGGMGRCTAGREPLPSEPLQFPHAQRQCEQFHPEGNP